MAAGTITTMMGAAEMDTILGLIILAIIFIGYAAYRINQGHES
jgi:hypothetical protein